MNSKQYYKCFSLNLKKFIDVHGIKPLSNGIHPVTKRTFYVYEMTDELSKILTRWSQNK